MTAHIDLGIGETRAFSVTCSFEQTHVNVSPNTGMIGIRIAIFFPSIAGKHNSKVIPRPPRIQNLLLRELTTRHRSDEMMMTKLPKLKDQLGSGLALRQPKPKE